MTFHNVLLPEEDQERGPQPADGGDLYEALVHVPVGDLPMADVLDAYIRATCVAAGVGFDQELLGELTAKLNRKRLVSSWRP